MPLTYKSFEGIYEASEEDKRKARIELSYIRAAITLASGDNDIASEISIGPFKIGISVNNRIINVLQAEADEIEKYLRGEDNNWE